MTSRAGRSLAHTWSGRMGDGCTLCLPTVCLMCVSKLATHFCTLGALHPFVDMALYFLEIHIFTSAEGINNYQSAPIQCSTWLLCTCCSLCCYFPDRFHRNVWHECTKMSDYSWLKLRLADCCQGWFSLELDYRLFISVTWFYQDAI